MATRKMSRLEQLALEEAIIRDQMAGSNLSLARAFTERLREINDEREAILKAERVAQGPPVVVVEVQTVEIVAVVSVPRKRFPVKIAIILFVLLCASLLVVVLL